MKKYIDFILAQFANSKIDSAVIINDVINGMTGR